MLVSGAVPYATLADLSCVVRCFAYFLRIHCSFWFSRLLLAVPRSQSQGNSLVVSHHSSEKFSLLRVYLREGDGTSVELHILTTHLHRDESGLREVVC